MSSSIAATLTLVPAPLRRTGRRISRILRVETEPDTEFDLVTGLLKREVFVERAARFVERAAADGREVAIVSVFVHDIDVPDCGYAEAERNLLLRVIATELHDVVSPEDEVGRVGLAEMMIVTMVDSSGNAARRMTSARRHFDMALSALPSATEAGYDVGHAMVCGRSVGVDQLIDESRRHRLSNVA